MSWVERFWSKVDRSGDCWEWQASRSTHGYGFFGRDGKVLYAHRVSYEITNGLIPKGPKRLHVCHHCDNPPCVRPDHLFLGTASDNLNDAYRKGRIDLPVWHQTECKRGHPLFGENLYLCRGIRCCRECRREAVRAFRRRKAENGPKEGLAAISNEATLPRENR